MTIALIPTRFVNVRNGEVSIGYRIYDDYDKSYCNIMNLNDPTYKIPDDDLAFLNDAMEYLKGDSASKTIIEYIKEMKCGVTIGDEYYDYDQIKDSL